MDQAALPDRFAGFLSPSSFWVPQWIPELSAWHEHGPFAFWITGIHHPGHLVELGTHWGFSYMAFCQSVRRNKLDTKCYAIDTWKGDEQTSFYGEEVLTALNAYNQNHYPDFSNLIRSTFDETLPHFPDGSIDLLHIDGFHTYEAVKHDFESWLPKMSARGIVLFHDTNVMEGNFGVHRLWKELTPNHPHFEFFHGHGLGILGVGSGFSPVLQNLFSVGENSDAAQDIRNAYARLGSAIVQEVRIRNKPLGTQGIKGDAGEAFFSENTDEN